MRTRAEHLKWCKDRALEYADAGDYKNAIASMLSDLQKHEETKINNSALHMLGILAAQSGNVEEVRRYINGFN